jgi:transcriptional regulator with XRE-family HTH domain
MTESHAVDALRQQLGRQLKALRQAAGLTQKELASQTGYVRSTVSYAEVGRPYVARPFWEHCDTALSAEGELVTGFDEIQAMLAAERERAAKSARAAQRRLAASLREAKATAQPCPHCHKPVIVVTALQAPAAASTTHSPGLDAPP